jgi:SpoVK/Ycf46/Vps4 family AAA+-type ATPase
MGAFDIFKPKQLPAIVIQHPAPYQPQAYQEPPRRPQSVIPPEFLAGYADLQRGRMEGGEVVMRVEPTEKGGVEVKTIVTPSTEPRAKAPVQVAPSADYGAELGYLKGRLEGLQREADKAADALRPTIIRRPLRRTPRLLRGADVPGYSELMIQERSYDKRELETLVRAAQKEIREMSAAFEREMEQYKASDAQDEETGKDTSEWYTQLRRMVGMEGVLEEFVRVFDSSIGASKREGQGIKTPPRSMHAIFVGSPGTGKTTVARLYGQMLCEAGLLKRGHCVEVTRTDVIGEYIGHTGPKMRAKINAARDGVLFIDEAYSLFSSSAQDFGQQALAELVKQMEDMRGELAVVVAGYPSEMEDMLQSNPGLKSRFTRQINFRDLTIGEMWGVLKGLLEEYRLRLAPDGERSAKSAIGAHFRRRPPDYANARDMRRFFEAIYERHIAQASGDQVSASTVDAAAASARLVAAK